MLLLYLRIFTTDRFRQVTVGIIIFIVLHTFGFLMATCLQCVPVKGIWDMTVRAKCIDSNALVFAGAGFSIAEDMVIIFLPIPVLKNLQLGLRKRIGLIFMFALGSL
jgi:hypothetical protein